MKRKTNPNSLVALEPYKWRPGVSGNPQGTRRGGSWTVRESVKQLLAAEDLTRGDLCRMPGYVEPPHEPIWWPWGQH